jgi:disulfide bond formation protein DsbB
VTVERSLRLLAGAIILVSLGLAYYVSHYWLWLTAFVGLNLLQSGFTNWCPAMAIFRALGLKDVACAKEV